MDRVSRFLIVGGGASGTLLATQLLRQTRTPIELLLADPEQVGRGVAYGTPYLEHRLNVTAGRMSALPDDADHFVRWLGARGEAAEPTRYVPRATYGEYLRATLVEAVAAAGPGIRFRWLWDEVTAVRVYEDGARVELRAGGTVSADRVALALGEGPGKGPHPELATEPRYLPNPWARGAVESIGPSEKVLVLGTGLTMVDVALALRQRGHTGGILAISRHGLLPRVHGASRPVAFPARDGQTLRAWVRYLRRRVAERPEDWRSVVDGLRPITAAVWTRLSRADRARFLRHLRAIWDVHRHRMAPGIGEAVAEMQTRGLLGATAARLVDAGPRGDGFDVVLRPRGGEGERRLRVGWIVNATGSEVDPGRSDSPLLRQLLRDGLVRVDELGLGLDATAEGAVVGAWREPSSILFTLGPLLRGRLWETTAIPEIRIQAQRLAARWLDDAEAVESATVRAHATLTGGHEPPPSLQEEDLGAHLR